MFATQEHQTHLTPCPMQTLLKHSQWAFDFCWHPRCFRRTHHVALQSPPTLRNRSRELSLGVSQCLLWAWSEVRLVLLPSHTVHTTWPKACVTISLGRLSTRRNHCGQEVWCHRLNRRWQMLATSGQERSLTLSLILHELMITHMKSLQTLCAATWRLQLPEPCTHGIGRTRLEQITFEVVHMFHQWRLGQVSQWYPQLLSSVIAQSAATTSFPSEGSARKRNEFFYQAKRGYCGDPCLVTNM